MRLTMSACRSEIHEAIPAWDGLLQVYGALYLPVIFALLFQVNLEAWVRARINYEVTANLQNSMRVLIVN